MPGIHAGAIFGFLLFFFLWFFCDIDLIVFDQVSLPLNNISVHKLAVT